MENLMKRKTLSQPIHPLTLYTSASHREGRSFQEFDLLLNSCLLQMNPVMLPLQFFKTFMFSEALGLAMNYITVVGYLFHICSQVLIFI
jgi:hypothetical protein